MADRTMCGRWKRCAMIAAAAMLSLLVSAPGAPARADGKPGPGRWTKKAKMLLPRTEISVAALNGKIYVVGGYVEGSVTSYLNHEYDPATDKWRERRRLPIGLNHVGLAAHAGQLYAFGGFIRQNRDPVNVAFVYDPGADRWKDIAPMPAQRGSVAVVSFQGKLHLVGGAHGVQRGSRRSVTDHYVYDPQTNTYAPRAPLPERRDHMGLLVVGDQIHAFGGRLEDFNHNTGLHHVYDAKTDTWIARAPLPTPRSGFAAGLVGGFIVAAGGEGRKGVFNENEGYDPKTDRWFPLASMPFPRHGTGAAVIGDRMYIPGGGPVKGGSRRSDALDVFTLD